MYRCKRYKSRKHGETFIVKDVPGRSGVLFHAGNEAGDVGHPSGDTDGCILLGDGLLLDDAGYGVGVAHSKKAMRRFLDTLHGKDTFLLSISASI
jgi:hypothetical protein